MSIQKNEMGQTVNIEVINGSGLRVLSYVHKDTNWSNAQWVSGTNNNFMQYGDDDGSIFKSFTALDICAHEFGHGITQFTAGLFRPTAAVRVTAGWQ